MELPPETGLPQAAPLFSPELGRYLNPHEMADLQRQHEARWRARQAADEAERRQVEQEEAEAARVAEAERQAEIDAILQPLSQARMDELVAMRAANNSIVDSYAGATIEDDSEYRDAIEKITADQIEYWPVPSASDLGVNVDTLKPARGLLARFNAWLAREDAQLSAMIAGKVAHETRIKAPAKTEKAIDDLKAGDVLSYLAYFRSAGKDGSNKPQSAKREKLEGKLEQDRHAAEVAEAAMSILAVEIDLAVSRIRRMDRAIEDYIFEAILEYAGPVLSTRLTAAVDELRSVLTVMSGIAKIEIASMATDGPGFSRHVPSTFELKLPRFKLTGLPEDGFLIKLGGQSAATAATPWIELAARWKKDPQATPPAQLEEQFSEAYPRFDDTSTDDAEAA